MTVLELIIQPNGATIRNPLASGMVELFVDAQEAALGQKLVEFTVRTGIAATSITIFVAEELLFFKSFTLPLKTPDLKEAVQYQLGMLCPFNEDTFLYSFSTSRARNEYQVAFYAVERELVERYTREIAEAGYTISGLYPESQRYAAKTSAKGPWALLLPGRFNKLFVFSGSRLQGRLLCHGDPGFEDLAARCDTETIFHHAPPEGEGFRLASELLAEKPALKEFNLLPASYRRPDYFKAVISVLLALNLAALVSFAGLKIYRLTALEHRVETEIGKVMPAVKAVKKLQKRELELKKAIGRIKELGQNPDLIGLLGKLTAKLPQDSYLDQLQLDKKTGAVHIRGYTEDIAALTAKLQGLGDIKLKSTSRRKNQTYFNLEIALP